MANGIVSCRIVTSVMMLKLQRNLQYLLDLDRVKTELEFTMKVYK